LQRYSADVASHVFCLLVHNNYAFLTVDDARDQTRYISTNLPAAKEGTQRNLRDALALSTKISDLRRKIDEARNITNNVCAIFLLV
jgi:hypothetical protein